MPDKLIIQICGPIGASPVSSSIVEGGSPKPAVRVLRHNRDVTLEVSMPNRFVGEAEAQLASAMLLDEMDQMKDTVVDTVHIRELRFSPQGAQSLKQFLQSHASTVKVVDLIGIVEEDTEDDSDVLTTLAETFQDSELLVLDLSRNKISEAVWKSWAGHLSLEQLVLRGVLMNDASFASMADHWKFYRLEDLNIEKKAPLSKAQVESLNGIIPDCQKLVSFRCVSGDRSNSGHLPWSGIAKLVDSSETICTLEHIAMEGAILEASDAEMIAKSLRSLSSLKTLNLRRNHITDRLLQPLIQALIVAKPSLEWLCLSHNLIENHGAGLIGSLAMVPCFLKSLVCVAVPCNKFDAEGAMNLYAAFSSKDSNAFNLHVGENNFDMGKLAFFMASASHRFGVERDRLQSERDRFRQSAQDAQKRLSKVLADQASLSNKLREAKGQAEKAGEERDALLKALAVMGSVEQAQQHAATTKRLNALEEKVFEDSQRVVRNSSSSSRSSNSGEYKSTHVPQPRRASIASGMVMARSRRASIGGPIYVGPPTNPPDYSSTSPLSSKQTNTGITPNSPAKYQIASKVGGVRNSSSDDSLLKERFRMPFMDEVGKPEIN